MTTELTMLVWSAVLCVLLAVPYSLGMVGRVGLPKMAGNRDDVPQPEGWMGRGKRAHLNMVENLVPFAALVLVAHAAGIHTPMAVLGAQLFFWARLAHAMVYLAGIPWIRTLAWAVGVAGMLLILLALLGV
jgi:uncharacterized MAPEG superfamily protein